MTLAIKLIMAILKEINAMTNYWLKFYLIVFCLLGFTACRQPKEPIAEQSNTLRMSMEGDPQTLDPRRVRDLPTVTVMHMLYEGLMRTQADGLIAPALAESITISPDQKIYTFHLRSNVWSDGQPLTAKDFEQTWKSLLDPKFPSPNAYQLYVIKGAQAAKEGHASPDQIGIYTLDDSILKVELEKPTPYFLHLTATHFFYPVHPLLRQQPADASTLPDSSVVTNGPFKLEKWSHHNELTAVKNIHYWDKNNVQLNRVQLVMLDNPTALHLFQNGELDWTGSPLSTLSVDALLSLRNQKKLEIYEVN